MQSEKRDRVALPAAPSDAFRRKAFVERTGERFRAAPFAAPARNFLRRAYRSALMLQSAGRGLRCTLPGGEAIRVRPEHRYLSWNPVEYAAFREAVGPGAVAMDVGANAGAYALLLGQWVGPEGRVFAFEPSPVAHQGLVHHIRLNGLQDVVQPVETAVGDEEGQAPLVVSPFAGESRLAGTADIDAMTVNTVTTSIDAFCARAGIVPDFIKVDVEGWELSVLRGARQTIARSPDLALFVELHPSIWPLVGVNRGDLLSELDAQHLRIEPLAPTEDIWSVEGLCVRLRRD